MGVALLPDEHEPGPDTCEDDAVSYARAQALPVLRTMRNIAVCGGKRGARDQVAAAKLLLEVGRLIGNKAEESKPLSAVKEAAKVIYLVDSDKAQELLSAQRKERP